MLSSLCSFPVTVCTLPHELGKVLTRCPLSAMFSRATGQRNARGLFNALTFCGAARQPYNRACIHRIPYFQSRHITLMIAAHIAQGGKLIECYCIACAHFYNKRNMYYTWLPMKAQQVFRHSFGENSYAVGDKLYASGLRRTYCAFSLQGIRRFLCKTLPHCFHAFSINATV